MGRGSKGRKTSGLRSSVPIRPTWGSLPRLRPPIRPTSPRPCCSFSASTRPASIARPVRRSPEPTRPGPDPGARPAPLSPLPGNPAPSRCRALRWHGHCFSSGQGGADDDLRRKNATKEGVMLRRYDPIADLFESWRDFDGIFRRFLGAADGPSLDLPTRLLLPKGGEAAAFAPG